jgi:hypothetical protein
MQNKKINTVDLDFDDIKLNLKSFLQGQTQFQDYDFEGSSLSVLLDVLSYNTHYNALYTNLAVNESFLDSASKRSSIVSRAKEIGYIPGSARCAEAIVDVVVTFTASTPTALTLPKNTQFTANVNNKKYTFYTLEDITAIYNGTNYTFSNVTIREGVPLTFRYVVSDSNRYIIPNIDVDKQTIKVRVQETGSSSNFVSFYNSEDIINISSTDKIFFIKEVEDELLELEFGNGVIGAALNTGNIVNIEYFVSSKEAPNGSRLFSYQGSSLLGGIVSVITKLPATGGVDKEGIETIRYNAPRAYQAQNRGVTVNDYKSIILSSYDEAESVNVWGGEDNIPPVYGKVFISIKPKSSESLSFSQKNFVVTNILKPKNVVTITPEIVDPEYIDLDISTTVYYNPKNTSRTENQLKSLVSQTINNYNDSYLDSFDGIFRFSQYSREVDGSENSIVSSITTIKLRREVNPKYNLSANYAINLVNPIYYSGVPEQAILTTGFYLAGHTEVMYLEDLPLSDNMGTFRIFFFDTDLNKQYLEQTIGSIVYSTGTIDIKGLTVTGIEDVSWDFIIKPQSNDVVSVRNQLVRILEQHVTVNVIVDKVSVGDAAGNSNYIFTSSRN